MTDQDEQRQSELFNKKIASQQDYTNAVQANLAAKAQVEAARAALDQGQLNLEFATITRRLPELSAALISASVIMLQPAARAPR